MTRKKWKIHGLEKAFENVPEEERARVAAEIEEELTDFDPDDPPGEPVLPVPPGTRTCPRCNGTLVELGFIPSPSPESEAMCVLECESCDATFCESAQPLQ
jgi:hypothetical protein